jgi:2'-acyl-2-O-sulfo-trehalose (hydroxy)phthioceranyltransferase
MRIGPVEISTIHEWEPSAGSLVSWHPSPASRAKAQEAPESDVPPSYIQARHLRSFSQQAARGLDHSRLLIASCEVYGRCDVRAMSYVINAHLRRHDTYRSWFDYQDADHIVRHTIADPADIEFVPTEQGEKNAAEVRDHILATPDLLHWDCFSFGIIQRADRFTFYASVDHLHADGQFVGVGLMEFQTMYAALAMGEPPVGLGQAGSYADYCLRQREYTSALTLDSPEVRTWVDFAEANNGTFPAFPLPLGDPSVPCNGDLLSVTLMDQQQTDKFESACIAAGARFIGGMFACIALAIQELTDAETYSALTPKDTRSTQAELTTQGWFTGLTPVTFSVAATSFDDAARAAQASFDSGADLAKVPFERVVELAPSLSRPQPLFSLVNFFDAHVAPLSMLTKLFENQNVVTCSDGRVTYPLSTLVGRFDETAATVMFPNNPAARESVTQYLAALKSVCVRVANVWVPRRARDATELSGQPAC